MQRFLSFNRRAYSRAQSIKPVRHRPSHPVQKIDNAKHAEGKFEDYEKSEQLYAALAKLDIDAVEQRSDGNQHRKP
jgi:hypothetical protein